MSITSPKLRYAQLQYILRSGSMNITITARKTSVKDSFKERVEKKLAKFDRFFDDDAKAVVTITNENGRETVEITVQVQGMFFRAEKTTSDRFDSLEAVADSLFRQIVRNKNKLEKRLKTDAFDPMFKDEAIAVEDEEYKVVRVKKFPIKPMAVDEAILQMDLLGHTFFAFKNEDNGAFAVVYKRNDGGYGLIEDEG